MELNPHVCVSPETGFSHAEIRAATSKQNKEPNVCVRDTKSIVSAVLEHSVCSQCPSKAALYQQNVTNLLNKCSFVLSAHDTLSLFQNLVSCIAVCSILAQMKPYVSLIWNTLIRQQRLNGTFGTAFGSMMSYNTAYVDSSLCFGTRILILFFSKTDNRSLLTDH